MRASRLVALVLRLQRGGTTAAELADELEVSIRTVYRDVSALHEAGVPIRTEPGPRGGVRLLEGWRTRLEGLTADEAGALFLAGAPTAVAELGLGTVLAAAQAKVLSTLPPELRARAGRVQERFHLDAPGWFQREESLPHLAAVADAIWSEHRIEVGYRRGEPQGEVRRRLDPVGLVLKGGVWYLVARHGTDLRTYRVARLTSVDVMDDRFERPPGFRLAEWWAESSADFDRSILRSRVRLRVSARALVLLPHLVPPSGREAAASAGPPDGDGWREVDLAVESEEVAAEQLAGLGAGVEVLDPPSLRASLAATGSEMAANNA